jgi:acyl-CoA reductase-like NAD-dependent aldehyde dehydrogenase
MDGAMFNAGQCCCGIERIYVARPLFDAFVEKGRVVTSGLKLGNPLDPDTTIGPMANVRFAGRGAGADIRSACGGARGADRSGRCFPRMMAAPI